MMPKGKKITDGYATVDSDDDDAHDYRTISQIMTDRGHKMNFSSVRNYLLRAMRKFAGGLFDHFGIEMNPDDIEAIARNPRFQNTIGVMLQNEHLRVEKHADNYENGQTITDVPAGPETDANSDVDH